MSRQIKDKSVDPEAELLVAFVNTRDLELDADAIAAAPDLTAWVAANVAGLDSLGAVEPAEHRRLLALRESLRVMLAANNGGEPVAEQLEALREAAERSCYRANLGAGGRLDLEPLGSGLEALEARLLLAVERVQARGEWPRLKVCPADECQWAFIDTSRNRSRTWCSMDVCGNRAKTRRYRSRKAPG